MATLSKITPFLWFDTQAEEAASYYTGLFEDSRITEITRYGEAGPRPAGMVMTVDFELAGRPFVALNGGPDFTFNEAISLQVTCESQEEVDRLWGELTAEGEEGPCGWCKDRYGLSWQIVPQVLFDLLADPDPGRSQRAMQCMLGMKKLDAAELQRAAEAA
jgi:predicted 3-demethylubiquinone-9 3-methyltransferase (glyoxalase superfamily)